MATNSQSITKNEPVSPLSSRRNHCKFVRAARVFGMDPAQKEKSIGSVAVNSGKYQKHTAKQYFLCRPIHQISNFIIATERYQKMRWYPERCGKMSTPGSSTRTTQLVLVEPQCRQFCECAELVRDGPCNSNDNGPKFTNQNMSPSQK